MKNNETLAVLPSMRESFRQKLLRNMYPIIRKLGRRGKNGTVLYNAGYIKPFTSLYELSVTLNNGKTILFSELRGRKIILVNTASDCGYTGQYAELQSLSEKYGNRFNIIAFPSNDFAGQEKAADHEIAQFCQVNYGVTFPLARKGSVLKKPDQQPVFNWLSNKTLNGWNDHAPDWNFGKYIVDENGVLTHYFGPSVSPLDEQFLKALK
ncbi:MAG: glutathione peroxidase [Bacteroidales bacterium]|nr:glutathione peroxidase [Bacteroidales bacterium]